MGDKLDIIAKSDNHLDSSSIYAMFGSLGLLAANVMFSIMPGFNIPFLILAGASVWNVFLNEKVDAWEYIFKSLNLVNKEKNVPELVKHDVNEVGTYFQFKLPIGLCLSDFERFREELETILKHPIELSITNDYLLNIQICQNTYKSEYKPKYSLTEDMVYPVGIAFTPEGEKEVYLDLLGSSHTLVGGINGSGKTSFCKCLLTAMCLQGIELKILDMKMGGDYNVFRNYKNLTAFIKNVDTAREEIENVKDIMTKRFEELDKTNCKDYKDYNKRFKNNKMQPMVVMIDEYTMLSDNKKFNKELNLILAMSRAVNIKVILSIQRPCHENLNTKLKANLNNTVAFMCRNTYNSEILLDKGDYRAVTDLHDKGEAVLLTDNQNVEFKSYYLSDEEIRNLIKDQCSTNNKVVKMPKKKEPEDVLKALGI